MKPQATTNFFDDLEKQINAGVEICAKNAHGNIEGIIAAFQVRGYEMKRSLDQLELLERFPMTIAANIVLVEFMYEVLKVYIDAFNDRSMVKVLIPKLSLTANTEGFFEHNLMNVFEMIPRAAYMAVLDSNSKLSLNRQKNEIRKHISALSNALYANGENTDNHHIKFLQNRLLTLQDDDSPVPGEREKEPFRKDGFEIFDSLMQELKGKRDIQSTIFFVYERMVRDGLIKISKRDFQDWLADCRGLIVGPLKANVKDIRGHKLALYEKLKAAART